MFQSFRESAGYHGDNNCDFCGFHAGWMSWPVHSHSSQHHGKNFNNLCITEQKHHRCVFTGLNVKRMLWLLWYFSFKYSLRYICVKNNLSAHFQAFFPPQIEICHTVWMWIIQKLLMTKVWHFHEPFLPLKWTRICNLGPMYQKYTG